jgi:hypothetical protein
MKHFITLMLLITTAVCGYSRSTNQPGQVSAKIHNLRAQQFEPVNLLKTTSRDYYVDLLKEVSNYDLFDLDLNTLNQIQGRSPKYIKLYLPSLNKNVLLYQSDILATGFRVETSSGGYYMPSGVINYHGIVEGDDNSIVAITIANNEVIGLVSNDDGNYVIGKLKLSNKHIVYNDHNLKNDKKFVCETITDVPTTSGIPDTTAGLVNKCVNLYYETDYDIFVGKGSVANVTSYILGLFNQVSLLYANDGINVKLKTLFVWDTGDPYNGTTTSTLLNQFGQYRTTFDGDLAHLLGYVGSGGVAFLNTLCVSNTANRMAYSDINPTYSVLPTYSWSVEVLTHEQGHNLGSPHTHDCAWNGNNTPIDGCGPAAGYTTNCTAGPLPTNGGTIMSYCHLISSVGINFNNGFGPQPTTLMQNRINTVTCLVACDTTGTGTGGGGGGGTGGCTSAPATPAITGPATACSGTTAVYTATFDPNATSYLWTVPPGWAWSGTNTTNTLNVTVGSSSGDITVYAINACGNSATQTLPVVGLSKPGTPSSITGPTSVCANQQNVVYTVSPVPGVQNYYWSAPTGSTINGTNSNNFSGPSTSISVNFGNKRGKITVKGLNICGAGTQKSINISFSCKLSDIEEALTMAVYPNPASNLINLDIESSYDDVAVIKMFDVHNRLCTIESKPLEYGYNHYELDVTKLPTGLYVVQIESNNGITSNKVLITR